MEHIGQFPCSYCNISFNRMCQCIHSCCSRQALWHRRHHIRINKCNNRNIMRVYTNHFTIFRRIGNYIVNRNLGSRSRCRRYCENRYTLIPCIDCTFKTYHIFMLRVINNNSNCFCCIHRRTTAYRNQIIRFCILECLHTSLYILNGWIWLNIGI